MQKSPITTLIHTLAETMFDGNDTTPESWTSFSIILETFEGSFNSFHGYAYNDAAIIPVAANPLKVIPVLNDYLKTLYTPGDALPKAMLLQFDKKTGHYNVTIEDIDENRWKVTPKNYKEIREAIRPVFD